MWQHKKMIEFRPLPDDHPDLAHSHLLRAAMLTLQYAKVHGPISLTQTRAFKRVFVHWAVENFDWPGCDAEFMFKYNKVINEFEFPPLELLHYLLITLKLGRHYNGTFRLTKRGAALADAPGKLFAEIIPFFVLRIDHALYSRFARGPFGSWDVWMNVMNIETDQGATERSLYKAFYGSIKEEHKGGWRELRNFSACVLQPLAWSGMIKLVPDEASGYCTDQVFKTPLWRSVLKLDTDNMLHPMNVQ
jgi:hypothetical protein